ncbi:MAG TPA: hypothetical protein VK933_18240 [Longimicrobiales bacterium]|nr:hypothetical protein [Longimicrobiales bacterium]
MRSLLHKLAVALVLVLAPVAALRAQESTGLDLSQIQLPAGFLELSDLVIYGGSEGGVSALASTTLMGSSAEVLISMDGGSAGRREWLMAIQPSEWSFGEAIPALALPALEGLTISGVVLVVTNREVTLESASLPDDEYWFYRAAFPFDDFSLTLSPGVNLFGTIPAEGLPAEHPLRVVIDALGIEQGGIFLHGSLGRSLTMLSNPASAGAGAIRDLYLRAELPPMSPPGAPAWFESGQLALELTGAPSMRLVGEINIVMDEQALQFFLAAALARSGISLAGGLSAEGGWQQPFGIQWLTLNEVVLALGITPTGSIQPGFAASMVIGEKDIDVALSVAISPAGVPTSMMISGESEDGFGLSDLVDLQMRMAAARDAAAAASGASASTSATIPVDALPAIDFRSVALQFAPKDAPELGVERGMKIKGEMWLPLGPDGGQTNFAGVDIGVTEDGLWARGNLAAFTAGPLVWEDAEIDLTATRDAQHLIVKGDATLFGARQAVDLTLTRELLSFQSRTDLFDMFTADLRATGAFNLARPDFQVDAVVSADFGDAIGPVVQQGIVAFAAAGADVLATATAASQAAEQALAIPQATVDQLRQVLETQRAVAANAVSVANATAIQRRGAMNSALAARNRALGTYRSTPLLPAAHKAQTLTAYQRAHAAYVSSSIAYNGSMAVLAATQRVYSAIPPVDQNVQLMRADAALAELRAQLRTLQQNLAELENQYALINAAVERGEQVLVIERAEFHGGLQSAMNGDPIRWDIFGEFVGEPFEVHETMDFTNMGEGAAQLLQALIGR